MPPPIAHDVTLNFGRPDIARFILQSFNATPSPNTSAGLVGTGMLSSSTKATPRPNGGGSGGAAATAGANRLDATQVCRAGTYCTPSWRWIQRPDDG